MDSGANAELQRADREPDITASPPASPLNASYTWSHSLSDAPELWGYDQSTAIEDPTNRNRDYGNSIINRPNAFTMSAVFMPTYKLDNHFLNRLANGNQLTLLATIQNGDEESITTSTRAEQRSDRTRRSVRSASDATPSARRMSIRSTCATRARCSPIRERLNAKFIFEGLNMFNTRNFTTTNTTAGTNALGVITTQPTFAPTSSVLEGRLLQIGIRADW